MYTSQNFKTKKAVKDAVAQRVAFLASKQNPLVGGGPSLVTPRAITVYQPNGGFTNTQPPTNGKVHLFGPHYPEPHRWYAEAWLENGEVIKVK